jgi:hypothetical protein
MAIAVLPTAVGPTTTITVFDFTPQFTLPLFLISCRKKYYLAPVFHHNRYMIKYTNQFLTKMEDMIAESDYILRYEKGNFKSGYCLLRDQKIMIINKFYTIEGKINALLEILKSTELDTSRFTEKSKNLYDELMQAEVKI